MGLIWAKSAYVESLRVSMQYAGEPQLLELLLQTRGQTGVHAASSTEHDGLVETGAHVDVGTLDGVEQQLGDTWLVDVDQVRLEETLGSLEPLAAHADDTAVGEGVGLDEDRRVFRELLVQFQIVRDVAQLLLDLAHGLEVGRAVEGVTAAEEKGDQVAGDVATSNVQSVDVVVQDGGFIDGDNVGDTVSGIDDDTTAETCDSPKKSMELSR